jgi:hypothetical protein
MPKLQTERNETILKLHTDDPVRYSYLKLAKLFGTSKTNVHRIIHETIARKNSSAELSGVGELSTEIDLHNLNA